MHARPRRRPGVQSAKAYAGEEGCCRRWTRQHRRHQGGACEELRGASASAPVVVFVSKMFAVPYSMLPSKGLKGEQLMNHNHGRHNEPGLEEECFLAFARVFSGVLRAGQKVFVLSPLYDPVKGDEASGRASMCRRWSCSACTRCLGRTWYRLTVRLPAMFSQSRGLDSKC